MGDVNKKEERIGQKRITKNGIEMVCVDYVDNQNIIVEIQDDNKAKIKTTWAKFDKSSELLKAKKQIRLGEEKQNHQGYTMKIVEYNNSHDIIVEFQDEYKCKINTTYSHFTKGKMNNPFESIKRLNEENINFQGCLMKIIGYNSAKDVIVEFQDKYKYTIHSSYGNFTKGTIKNPYYPSICGVGIKGVKYPASYINEVGETVQTLEYQTFSSMITRCYGKRYHSYQPTYSDVECCEEWLNRDNFEDWLRSQCNYKKFLNGGFALDKDILSKNSKIYSPDTCCLVPQRVNELFTKNKEKSTDLPTGVKKHGDKYTVYCCVNCRNTYIGTYNTVKEAAYAYKEFKENLIKNIAQEEFDKGNITKECYNAMMSYEVEIDD